MTALRSAGCGRSPSGSFRRSRCSSSRHNTYSAGSKRQRAVSVRRSTTVRCSSARPAPDAAAGPSPSLRQRPAHGCTDTRRPQPGLRASPTRGSRRRRPEPSTSSRAAQLPRPRIVTARNSPAGIAPAAAGSTVTFETLSVSSASTLLFRTEADHDQLTEHPDEGLELRLGRPERVAAARREGRHER